MFLVTYYAFNYAGIIGRCLSSFHWSNLFNILLLVLQTPDLCPNESLSTARSHFHSYFIFHQPLDRGTTLASQVPFQLWIISKNPLTV